MRRGGLPSAFLLAALWASAASAGDPAACPSYRAAPVAMTDPALCAALAARIRQPSAIPLDAYQVALNAFGANFCHRDADEGWTRDKFLRLTGPRVATLRDGSWSSRNFGTHAPVLVWYSAAMADWLRTWRADDVIAENAPPPPDGAIIVKEMFRSPTDACRDIDPAHLFPEIGAAIMVREAAGSRDGWFYGYSQNGDFTPDWPPRADNAPLGMGFGQYCINCHASAQTFTFASPENMLGEPGEPLSYLSQDFADHAPPAPMHDGPAPPAHALGAPLDAPDAAVVAALRAFVAEIPDRAAVKAMPAQTFDYDWIAAGGPGTDQTFTTAHVCAGCHDAGSTGLQYDMTTPNPHGPGLINLSPFATWRTSPMGLAGRDPFFFAQLASEVETFHPESRDLIETTCLGCHGAAGARQFQIDAHAADGSCPPVPRTIVDAVPYPHGHPSADEAKYGALARDGVTCTVCHRAVLKADAMAAALTEPQNACIEERQAQLNPGLTGFARTFTGSQPVGAPDMIIGPFADPRAVPMENAIGMTPKHDPDIRSAEVCGSCHTVHLPILSNGETLGHVFEQTTYPEWAFSAYRTGTTPDGALPHGSGERSQTCQDCHMPRRDAGGSLRVSKIASIQEFTNFPATTFSLGAVALDLPFREGVAEHTLVGLNLVLIKMAQQFPDLLGIHTRDPISGDIGLLPLERTEDAILAQAASGTAEIAVGDIRRDGATLSAAVTVTSHVGHKFPSGVGFRRAFLAFEVLDAEGAVLWASGRTNRGGAIVGRDGAPVDGELWWKDDCSGYLHPGERRHQPHFETIGAEDQVQIYQELVAAPPVGAVPGSCGLGAEPEGDLTTSFLSICATVKDNRILPAGTLPLSGRVAIAEALGAGVALAEEAGPHALGDDPDYITGGGDSVRYAVPLASLPAGAEPARLRATLYYQAQPPFYLQDRFCTSRSADTERLRYMVGHLDLAGTPAADWKLEIATTGTVAVPD